MNRPIRLANINLSHGFLANDFQKELNNYDLAERVGFEPTVPLRVHTLSRRASSTTPASLRIWFANILNSFRTTKVILVKSQID